MRNRRKRLLKDVDEVLADFQTPVLDVYFKITGKRLDPFDFEVWDIFQTFTEEERQAVFEEMKKPGFCTSIKPAPGAVDAVRELRRYVDVYPVTSPFNSPTWVSERYDWLHEHFGFHRKDIVFTGAKFLVDGDAFLDDRPENVVSWQAERPGKLAMLWGIPNTRKMVEHDAVRVTSWEELIRKVVDL
jgi:5'(3')-deoxyribonucleotidase